MNTEARPHRTEHRIEMRKAMIRNAYQRILAGMYGSIQVLGRLVSPCAKAIRAMSTANQWGSLAAANYIDSSARCTRVDSIEMGGGVVLGAFVELYLAPPLGNKAGIGSVRLASRSVLCTHTTIWAYGGVVLVGENTVIGTHCHIASYGKGISVGRNVLIASHCSMVDTQHVFSSTRAPIIEQSYSSQGIVIEDDVWLGSGVVVMDGVTIGSGSIVGAGSVVTKDVPPMSIVVGVPARELRSRIS
jgi:acetyltransferase-like isoleucine patch superfamily enzyme